MKTTTLFNANSFSMSLPGVGVVVQYAAYRLAIGTLCRKTRVRRLMFTKLLFRNTLCPDE